MSFRVAVFGLGEAGSEIARDLASAGADVHAFDPRDVATPPGVTRHVLAATAVPGAELICALTAAADAEYAIAQAISDIAPSAIYADFSTGSAGLKERLASVAAARGLAFADVALMAPVPGKGLRTPALVSGTGAARFADCLGSFGMPVECCGEFAGRAATRKLLRSVVIKGLAALLIESMEAAEAAGLADDNWANLVEQFRAADEEFLRRIVHGTYQHAHRRHHEMEAARDLLAELGVDPLMTRATVTSLHRIDVGQLPIVLPTAK